MFEKRNRQASKLTAEQVGEIRGHYADGATQGDLARYYKVSIGQIGRIVRGESWQGGQLEKSQADVDKSQTRLLAMMGAGTLGELVRRTAREDGMEVRVPAGAPASPLDGGDASWDAPSGLSVLEAKAASYGVDIDKLRRVT